MRKIRAIQTDPSRFTTDPSAARTELPVPPLAFFLREKKRKFKRIYPELCRQAESDTENPAAWQSDRHHLHDRVRKAHLSDIFHTAVDILPDGSYDYSILWTS